MVNEFYENYSRNGFHFSNEILTRYCLSLYTKPFVILSGISGTGKTKIAQLFKVPDATEAKAVRARPKVARPYLLINVTDGIISGDGRGNLRYNEETRKALFSNDELKELDRQIEELSKVGSDDNVIDPILIKIKDAKNNVVIDAGVYIQRAGSPLVRLRFKSKRGEDPAYDNREYFGTYYKPGDTIRLEKTGDKEFEIVESNNDDDKAEIEQELEDQSALVDNTCFVSVKSNWTDSSEIFGYYNPIEEKFLMGKVLKFFLMAKQFPGKPFFLILDEMNLSKVENYFSDFLSCIESRIHLEGKLKQEKIHLFSGQEFVNTNDVEFDEIQSSIEIPYNLYVTGTINVDETTYMFSPKVLDRANVIEFNEVDLTSYSRTDFSNSSSFTINNFPPFGDSEIAKREHFLLLDGQSKGFIIAINDILKPYKLHFGYRVVNEISLFLLNLKKFVDNSPETQKRGYDIQLAQKILPKLNGSIGKLEIPLKQLLIYLYENAGKEEVNAEYLDKLNPEKTEYPLSIGKIKHMLLHLYYNGYANSVE